MSDKTEAKKLLHKQYRKQRKMQPTQIIVVGFLCIIILGTLLLMLPISSANREFTDPITAMFTATSATCVTGLSVVTTAEYWSLFGQMIILTMIQVGGLGFMSMAVLFSMIVKRAITPRENLIIAESFSLFNREETAKGFVKKILVWTFVFEFTGALLLATRFIPRFGLIDGIYKSVFHSVSAFCNAGFDILGPDSLIGFSGDYIVVFTISALIIIGGIGFFIWFDISSGFKRKKFSAYTKLVLITTAVLLVSGTAATLILEWDNTLAGMSVAEKISASFAHSVSLRTAGFAFFDNASMTDALKFVSIGIMFIGGASGSTAGGIKVSTIAIIIVAVISNAIGREETVIFKRRVKQSVIVRAMSLFIIGITFAFASAIIISVTEDISIISSLYETVSAYATVGLSLSLTPTLGVLSKAILMVLMFMGRVGVLTLTFSLAMSSSKRRIYSTFADTNIMVG